MFETTNQINSLTWTKVICRMLPFKSSFSHDFYGGFTQVLPILFLVPRCFNSQVRCRSGRLNSPGISLTGSVVQDAETIEVLSWRKKHGMLLKWFSGNSLYITYVFLCMFFPAVSKKMFFSVSHCFFWPRAFFMFFMILDTWLIPVWPLLGPRGPYGGSTASFEAVETWKGGMTLNQAGMVVYIKLIHFFQMGIPPSTHLKSEC